MPTFDTPEPISATIDLVVGDVSITASDRQDTVVQVRPSDAAHEADVRVAEQTLVEHTASGLLVKAPRQRVLGMFGRPGSIDVTIELPAGSRVQGEASVASFHSVGRLGDCRIKLAAGDIRLDDAGPVDLSTSTGGIDAGHVTGHAEVTTATGRVRLRKVDGDAVVKTSKGDCWIGDITGDLRVRTANGEIAVGSAGHDVTASAANGSIRVAEITRGSVSLKTASGEIEVGVRRGTAARLDVSTRYGQVRNELETAASPDPSDEVAEVLARTGSGDVAIRRS
jgi:hypothetical protein